MLTTHYTYISASCCRFINFSTSQLLKVTQMCRCRRELIFPSCYVIYLVNVYTYVCSFVLIPLLFLFYPLMSFYCRFLLGWYVSFCRKRLKKNKNTLRNFSFGSIEICFDLHINHTSAEMKSRNDYRFMRWL